MVYRPRVSISKVELREILVNLSGYTDFELEYKYTYNPTDYGYYYLKSRRIELFVLDENLLSMDRDTLIKAGIHEITHHVLINHTDNLDEDFHGDTFKMDFAKYLNMHYNGKVPKAITKEIKKEGLYVSKKKGRPRSPRNDAGLY